VYQAILAEPDNIRRQAAWVVPAQVINATDGMSRKEVRSQAE
jgi:hypothetical protein